MPRLLGIDRAGEVIGLAIEEDAAARRLQMAGQDPHQRRLAGAVLADDGVDLAGLSSSETSLSTSIGPNDFEMRSARSTDCHARLRLSASGAG